MFAIGVAITGETNLYIKANTIKACAVLKPFIILVSFLVASALARSKESENLTDIYNVYYANRDEDAFKDAMVVWEDYIMSGQDNKLSNILQAIEHNESDADYDAQMFFELRRDHAHLVAFLIDYLEDINPELADLTKQKFIKLQGE